MKSVTIIVSHFESLNFLHAAIKQIRKHTHPEINYHIIVADQSRDLYHNNLVKQYWGDDDITIVKMQPLYSGFGLDYVLRYVEIETEYVCSLHVDAFPVHKNWLLLLIKLIEENNFSFVGQLHFISDGTHDIYPPSIPFFSMSPTFNVARTETYKEMGLKGGFTRFHNREESGLVFGNDDWREWASKDYNARGSDDDVVAFFWESKYKNTDKLGLAITGFIQPQFGRIIDDLVFHFGSCREATLVMDSMPESYRYYTKKINEGYTDELINEMVSLAKANQPSQSEILRRNFWNGKTKTSKPPSDELNKRIEELKNE